MAYSYTWEINGREMISDISDGFISRIGFTVKGIDGSTEKAAFSGGINLEKPESLPSDFVAFKDVTKEKCIEWVKADPSIDVTKIEENLKNKIDIVNAPIEKIGAPWD